MPDGPGDGRAADLRAILRDGEASRTWLLGIAGADAMFHAGQINATIGVGAGFALLGGLMLLAPRVAPEIPARRGDRETQPAISGGPQAKPMA